MNLEPIIQSELSQKENDRYHILTHIYRIQKNGTEELIYNATMEKQTWRIDLWTWVEGVRCMERVTWKLTLPCKIYSQQEFAVWLRKLKQGLCSNLEGWDGEGDGKEVQKGGDIYMYVADLC